MVFVKLIFFTLVLALGFPLLVTLLFCFSFY